MKHLLTGFLTFWLCLATQADDMDLYQGQSTGIPNNVMFLMDTSRSMSRWVYFDIGPYDHTVTYPIPINGFDPETYYYSIAVDGDGSTDTEADILHNRFLHKNAIVCEGAVDVIEEYGVITGRFRRWDPIDEAWEAPLIDWGSGIPLGDMRTDAIWECKNDEQVDPINKDIRFTGASNSSQYINRPQKYTEICVPFLGCGQVIRAEWIAYMAVYEAFWLNRVNNIFKGNYLNYQILERGENEDGGGNGTLDDRASRMTLARTAAKHAANTVQGFNLGLARFDSENNGGFIDLPVAPIATNKALFNEKIDNYFTYGGTPLSESYFEIARYYRGDGIATEGNVYFGNNTHSRIQTDTVNRFLSGLVSWSSAQFNSHTVDSPSVNNSRTGNTYISPINSACQATSAIVLFTDGEPQSDEGANSAIKSMIQHVASEFPSGLNPTSCGGNGGCADELAYYLANYDQSDLPGTQTIKTYVVGGFLEDNSGGEDDTGTDDGGSNNDLNGIPLLRSIAHHGDGEYFGANSYAEIVAALEDIFGSVSETPATFVAPAVSTNSYNSLEHQDELYYAMFQPNSGANWKGNLKLYKLRHDGQVIDANDRLLLGSNGEVQSNARSFWTPADSADGPNVPLGGAAQHLTKEHHIYTHLTTTAGALTTTISDTPEMRALMQIPASMSPADITKTLNWANRIDLDNIANDTRQEMEDPLHSRPVVINYATTANPTTGVVSSNSVVYAATNSGYLHAFKADKDNFQEYFSYIPKELLPNLSKYANDSSLRKDQLYGLDGHISYWFKDVDKDGQVDPSDGDQVILYIGMRRGGNHYYALDVTNPTAPEYLWQIDGGAGDFARLGQSWSEMTLAKVPFNGDEKVVLLFGGGYDESEDGATSASIDQLGNAIYMVDALSGNLLWKASKSGHHLDHSEMNASFMNNIRLVDYNGDRITDFFYVSDVAGRIWRFDIDRANTGADDFADGGIIFDANGDSSDTTYNRFYNSPSISYFKEDSGIGFMTISIGTGFRASPLALSSDDAFYVLKDYDITSKPADYIRQTPSGLAHYALADNSISNNINQRQGWKFTLPGASEKVLADALTTHGRVIFTSFAPASSSNSSTGTCSFDLGEAKAYTIDFQGGTDGLPTIDVPSCQATGTCTNIPPLIPPIVLTPKTPGCEELGTCPPCDDPAGCPPPPPRCEDGGAVVLVGTSKLGDTISRCGILEKDYWLERQ